MNGDDPGGYAQLWLSELGAHVPEHHAGDPYLETREGQFGLHLSEPDRARRHSRRLDEERRRRARSDAASRRA